MAAKRGRPRIRHEGKENTGSTLDHEFEGRGSYSSEDDGEDYEYNEVVVHAVDCRGGKCDCAEDA